MTYLFWSPTNTINLFKCLLRINIKSVIGIILSTYDFFVQRVMVFKPTDYIFLTSSQ